LNAAHDERPGNDPLRGLPLRVLLGPTASGKSALAMAVAERTGAEIVSLDSMQVYRGMDVGTAKPDAQERARVRHHMIDLVDPDERYDVQRFLRDLAPVLDDIRARGKTALFVGGTGFYLKVLAEGLFEGPNVDPLLRASLMERARTEGNDVLHAELLAVDAPSAARIHKNDVKRVVRGLEVWLQTGRALSAWQTQWGHASSGAPARRLVGLAVEPAILERRILERTRAMLEQGWAEEAGRIRAEPGFGETAVQALGYATALRVFDGEMGREEAAQAIALETRQFARRQRTWYRKFADITWLDATPSPRDAEPEEALAGEGLIPAAIRGLGLAGP
jgi:tRNA dimethylallyltransferase